MKKYIVATVSLFLSSSAFAESKIDQVVVFADRAEVTRVSTIGCKNRRAVAKFSPLPISIDARTLRAESKNAEVIGLVSERFRLRPEDGEIKAVLDEIEALGLKRQGLQDQIGTLNHGQNHYSTFDTLARQKISEDLRSARADRRSWDKTLDSFYQQRMDNRLQVFGLGEQVKKIDRRLQVLRRRQQKQMARYNKDWLRAEVTLDCGQRRKVPVSLTYVVPAATWQPEYDLKYYAKKGKIGPGTIKLTVAAVIQQATGEDWPAAKISLSTAKPKLGTEAPLPAPIYVSGYEDTKDKVLVQAQEKRERIRRGGGGGSSGPRSTAIDDQGSTVLLKIPHPTTVKSDGRPYWVPVDVLTTKAVGKLVSIPKLTYQVYHSVEFNSPASYPLLAGRLRSYRGEQLMGEVRLPIKSPGEFMEVSLGTDAELKVKRADLIGRSKARRMLREDKVLKGYFRNTLENQSKYPVVVEVRESIPVSKVEDLKVELNRKKTSKGFRFDERRGFVYWDLKLSQGQKRYVDLEYKVEMPSDWKVN